MEWNSCHHPDDALHQILRHLCFSGIVLDHSPKHHDSKQMISPLIGKQCFIFCRLEECDCVWRHHTSITTGRSWFWVTVFSFKHVVLDPICNENDGQQPKPSGIHAGINAKNCLFFALKADSNIRTVSFHHWLVYKGARIFSSSWNLNLIRATSLYNISGDHF